MAKSQEKIPPEIARELRALTHDLSNALETIVQANYLVSQSSPPEATRRWLEMITQASTQAVKLNQKLRQFLREKSSQS